MESQHESPLSFKQVIFGSLIFVVGIIAGAVASYSSSYQSGFNAAKDIVEKSSLGAMYRTPDVVQTLSGTVSDVSSSGFTLHSPSADPFADPSLNDRVVRIDAATAVYMIEPRDPKMYQEEMEAYVAALQLASSTQAAPTQPSPSIKVQTDASAITIGAPVIVTAAENIRDSKEFTATEIAIQPRAGAPL